MLADAAKVYLEPVVITVSRQIKRRHFFANIFLNFYSDTGGTNWGSYVRERAAKTPKIFVSLICLQQNGSFTGVLGMIETYKADTAAILFEHTPERAAFFDYSHLVWHVSSVFRGAPSAQFSARRFDMFSLRDQKLKKSAWIYGTRLRHINLKLGFAY